MLSKEIDNEEDYSYYEYYNMRIPHEDNLIEKILSKIKIDLLYTKKFLLRDE